MPDLPGCIGAVWLWVRRRLYSRADFLEEVCGRAAFEKPDAALHSAVPVTAALVLCSSPVSPVWPVSGTRAFGRPLTAFLLGWAGHVATDALTHGSDARPLFWPVSRWRFYSPVSYREPGRHGLPFTLAEHLILLVILMRMLRGRATGRS